MSVPKYDECMLPTLQFLSDGSSHKGKEIDAYLADQFSLSEEDLSEVMPSGSTTIFKSRASWARTFLKKAGLITATGRAVFQITDEGTNALKSNPTKIDNAFLSQYESFREFVKSGKGDSTDGKQEPAQDEDLTPDDKLEEAYKQINASLASDLLNEIMKIKPYAFEKMVVDLLVKMGYGKVEFGSHATAASSDEGVDGIIMEDKLGFNLIYMQAKKWNPDHVIGRPDLQNFVGAISGKHGDGLFVTTCKFSEPAKSYAAAHHIILIDGDRLTQLMIESNFCVQTKRRYEVKSIDIDAIEEYQEE